MTKTLNENYKKNIEVMTENLRRGLSLEQAKQVVKTFESQFKNADLYNENEKSFIRQLKAVIISHFTKIQVVAVE